MERPQKMGLSVSDHGQSLATFKHEPLPSKLSIRILTLRGCTSQGDLIQCDLTTYNLTPNEVPAYTALSYTWDGSDRKTPICVNGLRMDVTHNLWEALVHLRAIEERETSIGAAWQVRFASGYTTLPWCTVQKSYSRMCPQTRPTTTQSFHEQYLSHCSFSSKRTKPEGLL